MGLVWHLDAPQRPAIFANFTTGFAPGLAGVPTDLSYPIAI
jgi:hypothetical protein